MHEMSLMSNLLATAAAALAPYRVARVSCLRVKAGILANVLPSAFDFAFEVQSANTVFAGARLETEKTPLLAHCLSCGVQYASWEIPPRCPDCGGDVYAIDGGAEVVLDNIEFDEQEDEL